MSDADDARDPSPKPPLQWRFAVSLSAAVMYGPFLVGAIYALGFENSSNVRSGMWQLLPGAPAFLPTDFMYRKLNLPIPGRNDPIVFVHACASSLFFVVLQAWVLRQCRWLGYLFVTVSVVWFSFNAFVLLALLRA